MRSAVSVGASAAESIAGGKTNEAQCKPGVPSGFFGCCELRILAFFAARATYCLLPQMPTWRNWQTRWTQNPVDREVSVGSIPSVGIATLRTIVHSSAIPGRRPRRWATQEI